MHNYRSASQSVRASLQDSYARQGSANYLRSSALPRGQIALTKNLQLLNLWPEGAYGGAIAAGSRHSRLLRAGTARGLLSQPPECEARSRRESQFFSRHRAVERHFQPLEFVVRYRFVPMTQGLLQRLPELFPPSMLAMPTPRNQPDTLISRTKAVWPARI